MAKGNSARTQGFSSQGGRSFIPKNTTGGGYSGAEIDALSKVGATDLGIPLNDPSHVGLCSICGTPVAGSAQSDPSRYIEELQKGVHFNCFMRAEEARIKRAKSEFELLPEERKEELRAQAFNAAQVADPRDPAVGGGAAAAPYIPKAGELSLDRVTAAGGLSKVIVDEPIIDMSPPSPSDLAQEAQYKAKDQADIDELKKLGLIDSAGETSKE